MLPVQRDALLTALLLSARSQRLWDVTDRGMPVFVHQLDVALLCLEWSEDRVGLDLDAVLLGALVHDASKMPGETADPRSHSFLMRTDPEPVADVSMALIADAEAGSGVALDRSLRNHVRHIVLSHHGIHGKIQPGTAEARLVAACDQLSSTQHRVAPVDANDILPLLERGFRWREAAVRLGFGRELIKMRLREACEAEGVGEWVDLLPTWRREGRVRTGPQASQLERAKQVLEMARRVPDSLLDRLHATEGVGAAAAV